MRLPQLRHFLLARHRKGNGIHSPSLYRLVSHVLFSKNRFYCFDDIESLFPVPEREHAIGQTIFRLANDSNASALVACCDSNSIDLAYLKSVKADARLLCLSDTEKLSQSLENLPVIDLAVFDACADSAKLSDLFELCLERVHAESIFVIKNIHDRGMDQYWNAFVKHPQVRVSLDVFRYGILLFNPDLEKKQYFIRL